MKNCIAPEKLITRRILPIAGITALAVAYGASAARPAYANQLTSAPSFHLNTAESDTVRAIWQHRDRSTGWGKLLPGDESATISRDASHLRWRRMAILMQRAVS